MWQVDIVSYEIVYSDRKKLIYHLNFLLKAWREKLL